MSSKALAYINLAHSIVVGLISYLEFSDALHPSPEVNLTMFLALISLTFTNNMISGNKALINAALICTIAIFCLQTWFAFGIFDDQFQEDKIRKVIIISMNVIAISAHLLYRFKKS